MSHLKILAGCSDLDFCYPQLTKPAAKSPCASPPPPACSGRQKEVPCPHKMGPPCLDFWD